MSIFNLTAKDKLIRARVQLNQTQPFFGRITMSLKFVEDKSIPTMAVNNFGACLYNPEFVDSLTPDELKGVLCHEVMHCALNHLDRLGKKDIRVWNIATDLVINYMVTKNGLTLPSMVLGGGSEYDLRLPKGNHTIKDIDKRPADSIYQEIEGLLPVNKKGGNMNGDGVNLPQGHDKHIYGDDKDNQKQSEINKGVSHRNKDFWKNQLVESAMAGKMAGNAPSGLERIIDDILNPKMSWEQMLRKFVRDKIPFDYTWRRPHKRSFSTGVYMPRMMKEGMSLVLLLDTSGSMSKKDLEEVFGELKGIIQNIRGLDMHVIFHTTDVYEATHLTNPTLADLKAQIGKLQSGGTSHRPAFEYVEKNIRDADVLIAFTDGYSNFPKKCSIPTFFCIQKNGLSEEDAKKQIPFGTIVKMRD